MLICDCLDGSIVSNVGQFISVDSRPVSSRGTFKQIVSLYKGGVRLANDVGAKVVDPILCMNMVCPRGSYDANVEPAKDDVLFVNPDLVLRLAGKFFKSVYGERQLDMPKAKPSSTPGTHGIELMLAMRRTPGEDDSPIPRVPVPSTPPAMSHDLDLKDSHRQNMRLSYEPTNAVMVTSGTYMQGKELISGSTMVSTPSSSILPEASSELSGETLLPAEPSTNLTWKPSMYAEDDDDMEELDQFLAQSAQPAVDNGAEEDTALRSVHVSNPWVMAKLNAPFRPPLSVQQRDSHKDMKHQLPTPGRQVGDVGARTDHSTDDFIHDVTTPASDVAKPRQSGREFLNDPVHASFDPFPFPQKARASRHTAETPTRPNESNRERREHGALDTWVQRSLNSSVEPFGQDAATLEAVVEPAGFQHRGDFVSARSLPHGTALSDIPDASQKPRRRPAQRKQQQGTINKPFVSPVNDPEHVWFDAFDKPNRKYPQHTPRRREPKNTAGAAAKLILRDDEIEDVQLNMATTSQCSMHPDLAITMEYEARKQRAEHQRRELLRQKALAERRDARIVNDEPGSAAEAPNAKISPHKNRQYKAIAALHNADDPSVDAPFLKKTHAFQADDPRAYLVWEQQREAAQLQNGPNALRPKRRKNIMLPFETMPENNHIRELILPLTISRLEIENMVEKSTLHDEYIREGEDAEAFSSPTNREIGTWEEKLKLLIKASYRIEGMEAEEEMDGDLEVDLVAVLQKHAAEIARLETEEQALLEEQASQAYAAETIDLTGS